MSLKKLFKIKFFSKIDRDMFTANISSKFNREQRPTWQSLVLKHEFSCPSVWIPQCRVLWSFKCYFRLCYLFSNANANSNDNHHFLFRLKAVRGCQPESAVRFQLFVWGWEYETKFSKVLYWIKKGCILKVIHGNWTHTWRIKLKHNTKEGIKF